MFAKLFWNNKYRRFKKRWHDVPDVYKQFTYIDTIISLIEGIPEVEIPYLYQEYAYIPSAYPTLEQWLNEMAKRIDEVKKDQLTPQPTLPMVEVRLNDFLLTRENYAISYQSAIKATVEQLKLFYQVVTMYEEIQRDYYFRQLKELLLTGISFCKTLIFAYQER